MKVLGFDIRIRPLPQLTKLRRSIRTQVRSDINELRARALSLRRRAKLAANRAATFAEMIGKERVFNESAYQVRSGERGWEIVVSGNQEPLFVHEKKTVAIRHAKKLAREQRVDLDVFSKAGSLQARHRFTPVSI